MRVEDTAGATMTAPRSDDRAGALARLRDLSSDLAPRAARRGHASVRTRLGRLRQRSFLIVQVSVAAAVSYWVAADLLDHSRPFFAPIAAIIGLGMSYAQRPRRVAEVTAGVAVGVGVGDLLVGVIGSGVWQVFLVVCLAMAVAVLLDAGALIVTQAGVQSVIVTTLLPGASAGLDRCVDAAAGGVVALVVATVVPVTPLRQPRAQAARVLDELALLLREAARSARDGDVERATRTLDRARETDTVLSDLRSAAREGLSVSRTPLRRHHLDSVVAVAELAEPLDRAIRNVRVLVRRVTVAASRGEPVPEAYAHLAERLADIVEDMAAGLREKMLPTRARETLQDLARDSARVESSDTLSAVVVLAQVRSMIVDLLQLTGLDVDGAEQRVPPRPGQG
ncbi:MAG: FUSC family protein [Actinomycetes bacterium]